jgi:CHAT domain-containing protein
MRRKSNIELLKSAITRKQNLYGVLRNFGMSLLIASAGGLHAHAQDTDRLALDSSADSLRITLSIADNREERLGALWALADFYRNQGKYREAQRYIESAAAESRTDVERSLTALRGGGIATGLGLYAQASSLLTVAYENKALLDWGSSIALEMELGHLAVEQDSLDTAVSHFDAAAAQASDARYPNLEVKARINALRARMDNQDLAGLENRLADLQGQLGELDRNDQTAFLLVSSGDLHRRSVEEFRSDKELLGVAYDNYMTARELAQTDGARGYVYGFLGALYEYEGRLDEALRLTGKATFHAQAASADEQLYRWEWQTGRILKAQNDLDAARKAYERSVTILERIRPNFVLGSRQNFKKLIAPVYAEYADVLLQQSLVAKSQDEGQLLLTEVRNQLETLKRGELEDYFGNQCVVITDPDDGPGTSGESGVAVIYPVLLGDRIEVLVEVGGAMLQFTTPVDEGTVTQTVRELRLNLERSNSGSAYLASAQQLYQWLIAPSIDLLERYNVQTLMMVPGGALRTIPLSALHDGERFLIERFAIANTPAIGLLEQATPVTVSKLLIGGITESVQGFSELPSVAREIKTISSMYPSETMIDDAFVLDAVSQQLASSDYSVAHFATHGEFSGEFTESFIVTYDDKLTLNGLKTILDQRGDDQLDLLVLSACETAAGDDRAALGLAGVAVQSGAKSAIASLWYISDEATAELMSTFYTKLSDPNLTKAESLRQAQLSLLAREEFSHPSYWAPFLLIGSWL